VADAPPPPPHPAESSAVSMSTLDFPET
jgi:hypothetical protein